MQNLPPKSVMRKFGTFNKISKIYNQQFTDLTFEDVEQAKHFWLTDEGMELFEYCCDTEFQLTNNDKSLHWTVNFGEPELQIPENKWADLFRDKKEELVKEDRFFKTNPTIDHDAPELF